MSKKKTEKKLRRYENENALILQAVEWGAQFAESFGEAGIVPTMALADFPDDVIIMLFRNELQVG